MRKLLLIYFAPFFMFSQTYVDMTEDLADVNGTLLIDGNLLRKKNDTQGEIIILGRNMLIKNNARIILNNVIIQLSGDVILEDDAQIYPKLIESYIFCKNSDQWNSKYIIVKSGYEDVSLSKIKHIRKIKGNPKIHIYDPSGKKVYSGRKDEIKEVKVAIGRYDLRVEGKSFESDLLFY